MLLLLAAQLHTRAAQEGISLGLKDGEKDPEQELTPQFVASMHHCL